MPRRPGIADLPMEGAALGELNPLSDPVMQDRIDIRTTNIFDAAKVASTERYVPDRLSKRGTFKGLVLKVLPPPPQPFGWLRAFYEPLGIRPPALVRIRVRIPEMHAGIPEPSEFGDTDGDHQAIIEMHPIATAESDTLPAPAVGSIVECQYDDLANQDGLKYISAVGEQAQATSGGGSAADQAMSAAYQFAQTGQCGGLAATGPTGFPMGMGAGSYTSFSTPSPVVNNARRARYVEQLLRIGGFPDARQGDVAYELVPYTLVEEMILNGEIGLLALFIGAANWGISGLPADIGPDPMHPELSSWGRYSPIPGTDSLYSQARSAGALPDNAWPGKRASSGKHVMDGPGGPNMGPRGGIGIAHFDSSTMTEWYDILGPSPVPPELKELSYDQMNPGGGADSRVTPEIWQAWIQWCLGLVTSLEKQIYMCNHWVDDFFELERNGGDIAKTIINSRVSNSVSGVARGVAGQPIDAQIQRYHDYKLENRGQSNAERCVRQAMYAMRVVRCLEHVLNTVPDAEATILAAMSAPPEPRPEAAQQPITPSEPLYGPPLAPPPDGTAPDAPTPVYPASDDGYTARVHELMDSDDAEGATGIRIFVAGDPGARTVVHYFGGYGHKITGDRDSALRNVMGSMPPNIFTIGWGIGDYSGESVDSRYRGDANLVQLYDALEETIDTIAGFFGDPPELVYNTIETQARIIQGGPPSATRPTIKRILLFYSGGYHVFKKLYDLEVLQRADSGIYGLGFLDSLYGGNDYIRDLAANTNIKMAAVHNESYLNTTEERNAFNSELQALGRIGIHTNTSHSSIPKEFAAMIVQMMLTQASTGIP